jgi:hypothetical protein
VKAETAMDRWVSLFATRDELAIEYAKLLSNCPDWPSWPTLNLAIVDRWSVAGLRYVKKEAWKLRRAH